MPAPPETEDPGALHAILVAQVISILESAPPEYDSRRDEFVAHACRWVLDETGGWHAAGRFFGDGVLRVTSYRVTLPAFTRSIDDALTLLPMAAPCGVRRTSEAAYAWVGDPSHQYRAATPAMALCVAALRTGACL
jgi:hypothetical protein